MNWFKTMSAAVLTAAVGLVLTGSTLHAAEGQTKLRLATLVPKDTSIHKTLQEMGAKWTKDTQGGVSVTIYTDGTMGGEADMVRRMRVGQIQAALLSVSGLAQIDDSVRALQLMPMMFHSFEEFDYVQEKMRGTLEKRLAEKGFVVLFWGDAGWVRFFSKNPGVHPADFAKMKMFVWSGDSRSIEVMKSAGINAVPLEQADVLPGLQTGQIDCVPSVPFFALAGQFYGPAPHMIEVNWVPLVGATVITKKAWDTISPANRTAMLKAAEEAGKLVKQRSRAESVESVAAMEKKGLKVQKLSPELEAEWQKFAEDFYPKIRGKVVPEDLFDEVQKTVKEYRANAKK